MSYFKINESGIVTNPRVEIIKFPKSYKFNMEFTKAKIGGIQYYGHFWMNPEMGSGVGCHHSLDFNHSGVLTGLSLADYKREVIQNCVNKLIKKKYSKTSSCPSWYNNYTDKVIQKLQEYWDGIK